MDHAGVVDAVVIGLPDERLGAVPAALVVTNGTEPPDEAELLETLRQRLPGYMLPILVLRHDFMPYNAMLKKDRRAIAAMLTAERAAREQLAV